MPVLSRFYGIIIRMYFQQSEHNPPHIHAIYGEHVAAIDFQEKKIIEGELPKKSFRISNVMDYYSWERIKRNMGYSRFKKYKTTGIRRGFLCFIK